MVFGNMKCKEILKTLGRMGFSVVRQNGSHKFLKHVNTGHSFVISCNENESVGRPMLSKILRWANVSPDSFASFL